MFLNNKNLKEIKKKLFGGMGEQEAQPGNIHVVKMRNVARVVGNWTQYNLLMTADNVAS